MTCFLAPGVVETFGARHSVVPRPLSLWHLGLDYTNACHSGHSQTMRLSTKYVAKSLLSNQPFANSVVH